VKKYLIYKLLLSVLSVQKNNFYAELGVAGSFMIFNYERMVTKNILARVG
tara:strand:- start:618 stop:767 length:150 start_codon:yes stop_codon:yes gene_type:complete